MKIILALLVSTLAVLTAQAELKKAGDFVPSYCGDLIPRKVLNELNPLKKACVGEVITEVQGQKGEEAFSLGYQTGEPIIFKVQQKLRDLPAMATHKSRQLLITGMGREYMAIVTLPLTNPAKGGTLLIKTQDGREYSAKLEMVFVTQSLGVPSIGPVVGSPKGQENWSGDGINLRIDGQEAWVTFGCATAYAQNTWIPSRSNRKTQVDARGTYTAGPTGLRDPRGPKPVAKDVMIRAEYTGKKMTLKIIDNDNNKQIGATYSLEKGKSNRLQVCQ